MATVLGATGTSAFLPLTAAAHASVVQSLASTFAGSLSGVDTIVARHSGDVIKLGTASARVDLLGADTVKVGSGAATVAAFRSGHAAVDGGSGPLTFIDRSAASTVTGGSGAATVFGGFGSSTYRAGSGHSLIIAGAGADTMVGGSGSATLIGGAGKDVVEFIKGRSGGRDLIEHLTGQDTVKLVGYGEQEQGEVDAKLKAAALTGRDESLTLSDGTKVTFANITSHHTFG